MLPNLSRLREARRAGATAGPGDPPPLDRDPINVWNPGMNSFADFERETIETLEEFKDMLAGFKPRLAHFLVARYNDPENTNRQRDQMEVEFEKVRKTLHLFRLEVVKLRTGTDENWAVKINHFFDAYNYFRNELKQSARALAALARELGVHVRASMGPPPTVRAPRPPPPLRQRPSPSAPPSSPITP